MSEKALFYTALKGDQPEITIHFDGKPLLVPSGTTVAAALLVSGVTQFRTTPVSLTPRAPWCMMGVCFDCLVEIDGQPNRQSCLTTVRENMDVRTQEGAAHYE